MKIKYALVIAISFLIHALFLRSVIAKNYTQWKLPEGAKARLSKGEISGISYSSDGTQIAVGSPTGVWCYNARTGAELALLTDHLSTTGRVAFSPDGKTLASGMHDKILIWDIATGNKLKSIERWGSTIKGLRIFEDGKTLLCENDYDGSVQLWDINTGIKKKDFHPSGSRGFGAVFGSMIGREIAAADLYLNKIDDNGIYAIGYEDGKIRLEDATTGRRLRNLQGLKGYVRQLVFSPDGTRLADQTADGTIRLWEVTTGRVLKDLTQSSWAGGLLMFSKDGKTLACQGKTAEIELWDVEAQTLRVTLGNVGLQISMFTFSPDAKTVATANPSGEIRIWDANTGDAVSIFKTAHAAGLDALAFSPDGSTLASGDTATIRFWDMLTFTQRANPIQVQTALLRAWAFSPDGRTVTTTERLKFEKKTPDDAFVKESVLGRLSLWETHTSRKLSSFWIEWHEGGAPVLPGQKKPASFSGAMDGPHAFAQNGYMLAAALNSERATKKNRFTVHLWETPHGKLHFTLKGHTDKVNALAFTHRGHTLASASDDGTIRLWDASTGAQMLSLPSGKTRALAFSTDGKILASIRGAANIQVWDIATGGKLISLKGLSSFSDALAFSIDNKILASGNRDGVILWDIATGNKLATLKGQADWINALSFSPDGNTLASGSEGGAIFLWNVPQ